MAVDVLTSIDIDRPRRQVAAFAGDPSRAPEWYANIHSVEWISAPPVATHQLRRSAEKASTCNHFGAWDTGIYR